MSIWANLMLIAGGLFAGGAATFAWSRVPIWRRMPAQEFVGDFQETLRRTDKVQPALLVAAIVSAAGFALAADGSARLLALVGAAGFVATLAASLAILVPLQRRIVATKPAEAKAIDEMRVRWFRGHLGRSMLAAAAFVAVAVAATL
jgi:anthrone oxygenase-like protein